MTTSITGGTVIETKTFHRYWLCWLEENRFVVCSDPADYGGVTPQTNLLHPIMSENSLLTLLEEGDIKIIEGRYIFEEKN